MGVVGQLHLYLDDIFPNTYRQPLIDPSTPPHSHSEAEGHRLLCRRFEVAFPDD